MNKVFFNTLVSEESLVKFHPEIHYIFSELHVFNVFKQDFHFLTVKKSQSEEYKVLAWAPL
jgi:hypothetical protein